jgi:hypothetical protein
LVQFIKAMRDDEGKMVRNAHLIGTFRRIAKLLFHGIKPIFVFDGGVPVLKRRTVAQRRLHREVQSQNLRQHAQSILVAQLKRQIEEAHELKQQGKSAQGGFVAGFDPGTQGGSSMIIPTGNEVHQNINVASDEDIEWEDGDARNVLEADSEDEGAWNVGAHEVDDIDESSLRAMPVNVRKGIIETVHKDYRKKSRDSYLNVGIFCSVHVHSQLWDFKKKTFNAVGTGGRRHGGILLNPGYELPSSEQVQPKSVECCKREQRRAWGGFSINRIGFRKTIFPWSSVFSFNVAQRQWWSQHSTRRDKVS